MAVAPAEGSGNTPASYSEGADSFSERMRSRRMREMVSRMTRAGIKNAKTIDIGGSIDYWKIHLPNIPKGLIASIEVINLPPWPDHEEVCEGVLVQAHAGNALDISTVRLKHYDFLHSNSVIEHVGNLRSQEVMAKAIIALADHYWVQTPARSFPIEAHFCTPFFQHLPLGLKTVLHRSFRLGYMPREPDWLKARIDCDDVRLMNRRELAAVFPGAHIWKERYMGFCKSYSCTNLP